MRSVIVRPDAFQDLHLTSIGRFDMAHGRVEIFGTGNTKHRWVSVDDVAALLVAVAVEPDPPEVMEFGGPELLSRNETIAVAELETGRTIRRRRMPRPLVRLGMRVLGRLNPALASVFGLGLVVDLVEPDRDDAPLLNRGIDPKSASDFIREQAAALGTGTSS
jgi:uncharacterized protein YbjT (DUF2867 family)